MTTELEERLRAAYDELPVDTRGADALARSARHRGGQRKRLRVAAGIGGGLVAATAIITGVAVAGNAFSSGASSPHGLSPAGVHLDFSSKHPSTPTKPVTLPGPTDTTPDTKPRHDDSPDLYQGHNKKVAGLAGYLLPHGPQLPKGLSYSSHRSASNMDASSLGAAVVPMMVMARSNAQSDDTPDSTGQVASVLDSALNYRKDGSVRGDADPDQRALFTQIIRYQTVQQARVAVPTVQASEGGWIWIGATTDTISLPWSGVAGADGPSYLYKIPATYLPDQPKLKFDATYIAVQIVGKYAIAATGDSERTVSTAIESVMTNLKKANLL